jgi:butyrate kinase
MEGATRNSAASATPAIAPPTATVGAARPLVLAVNPGVATTGVGLFRGADAVAEHVERHPDGLGALRPQDQLQARARMVRAFLDHAGVTRESLAAVVGRGGLLRPVESGTYLVDEVMLRDAERAERGEVAANLGAPLAKAIADDHRCPAYVVDPISVDELDPVARFSGMAGITRQSLCHALPMRAVARRHADAVQRPLDQLRLVVAHLATTVSLCALREGRLVDVVNPTDEGPFAGESCGALPASVVLGMCFAPGATPEGVRRKLFGQGGLVSYLGTSDAREGAERAERDGKAMMVLEAMAYQIAKSVGQMAAALGGEVDAVLLTGRAAHATALVNGICRRVEWIAPVFVYPGDDELSALAQAAWRVLSGEEAAKRYA